MTSPRSKRAGAPIGVGVAGLVAAALRLLGWAGAPLA